MKLPPFLTLSTCWSVHQSAVHSHTLPIMFLWPNLEAGNSVTGPVPRHPSASVFSEGKVPVQMLARCSPPGNHLKRMNINIFSFHKNRCPHLVAPGEEPVLLARPARHLPLRLRGQPLARPLAVRHCVVPGDVNLEHCENIT